MRVCVCVRVSDGEGDGDLVGVGKVVSARVALTCAVSGFFEGSGLSFEEEEEEEACVGGWDSPLSWICAALASQRTSIPSATSEVDKERTPTSITVKNCATPGSVR